jgi:shikimate kinase
MALNLPITVRLLDRPSKRDISDPDGLLDRLLEAWQAAGQPLPEGYNAEELHWGVNSKIPAKQGLKSSAATCIAALRALENATEIRLEDHERVHLAATAQLAAGVSLTGSIDDAWGCMTPGWKLVDVQAPIEEGVLLEDEGLASDEWIVILVLRGPREHQPQLSDFEPHLPAFQQALDALQARNPLVALTWNGRGIAAALRDIDGRKMTNDSFMNSARAAGITGSGPALALVIPENQRAAVDRIKTWYTGRYKGIEILETSFLSLEGDDELE